MKQGPADWREAASLIIGLGTDLVDVVRVRKSLERWGRRWEEKLFTEQELKYLEKSSDPAPGYAARFAAKEALFKALPEQPAAFFPRQMEVFSDSNGKPSIRPVGDFEKALETFVPYRIHLSMTHEQTTATATVIIEKL